MSPTKSFELNGPRPSPLLIHKDSRIVRKPSNSNHHHRQQQQQQRQPVIIYTHSPKIIHTQPKNFMALVQRLTGFNRSEADERTLPMLAQTISDGNIDVGIVSGHNDNDSSSVLTEENCGGIDIQTSSSDGSPRAKKVHSNRYLADIPLFTPRSSDLFDSPRPLLRFADASPNFGGSMSPSLVEFLKGLPDF